MKVNLPLIPTLQESWNKDKVVNIKPLFTEGEANNIHNYYFNKSNSEWNLAMYPDFVDHKEYTIPIVKESDEDYDDRLKHIRKKRDKGEFSYFYKRLNGVENFHPHIVNLFFSENFWNYISQVTGYNNLTLNPDDCFVSNYSEGNYNGPHTDGENGRVAFVYHLSKDWKPELGGLFCRLDWDYQTVNKIVSPPFNCLTLFDTVWDGKEGSPHFVSEVTAGCDNKRISFTGWFS